MQLKTQDYYYEVYPKVLTVGKPATVTIRPKYDHVAFKADHIYQVLASERETYTKNPITPEIADGKLTYTFTPSFEQEYTLVLTDQWPNGRSKRYEFSLYAVNEDLAGLRPWKGDFHLHSCRSDGQESPVYVASSYRQAGFDFFALTDHHQMPPSHEVMDAFKALDTDFRVYPGEEVHPPRNPVHHINFGGSFSVNDLHRQKEQYEAELAAMVETVKLPYLNEEDRKKYASSLWVFQKIREAGGISIFCHPYWITGDHYNVDEALMQAFFEECKFDAFELYGGFYKHQYEANDLQVARWADEQSKGKRIPVVGVSDSHGVTNATLFNEYYTLVFAPSTEFVDLATAIRDCRSVAVSALADEQVHCLGQFRFVKYAYFCLREILPLHDEECREEGRQMLKYFAGDADAAAEVAHCKERVAKLYAKLFA